MEKYVNPFESRYSSKEMLHLFSPKFKYTVWRDLWIALAESESELGLNISQRQIDALKAKKDIFNWQRISELESKFKHEVMAHLHAFGEEAGEDATKILHLGATSAFVMDNGDSIQISLALEIIEKGLVNLLKNLSEFSLKYASLPIIGYTHFQQGQLVTLGKRSSLWLQSFYFDYKELKELQSSLFFRGVKGTLGTQDSFKVLFHGDYGKVQELDRLVSTKMGWDSNNFLTNQIYDRKLDSRVLNFLSNLAQSAHKMTNDIRLMQHLKEVEEGFAKNQIGSSAMAYKRNPIYCERVSSLSKFVITLPTSSAMIASTQWLERTLDDSACRRITIPQGFMASDAILILLNNITNNLRVNEKVIEANVNKALPFLATESILMRATEKGGNRQELHEKIRQSSMRVTEAFYEGNSNISLLKLILEDPSFNLTSEEINEVLDPKDMIGFCPEQVRSFIEKNISPILQDENYDFKSENFTNLKV